MIFTLYVMRNAPPARSASRLFCHAPYTLFYCSARD